MTTTKLPTASVLVRVSEPYRTVGYQGGRYGASQFTKRDYTAVVIFGEGTEPVTFQDTSKAETQSKIRARFMREGMRVRVVFQFAAEGSCAYTAEGSVTTMDECAATGCDLCAFELDENGA
jgi:hypothetical protein